MTTKNQRHPSRPFVVGTLGTGSRLFLALLSFVAVSAFAATQTRYTVNRPVIMPPATTPTVTTPTATPETTPETPAEDDWSDYTPQHTAPIYWETDYEYARDTAKISSRFLLIYLCADDESEIPATLAALPVVSACRKFDTVVLDDSFVRSGLCRYVLLKLPIDAQITDEDGVETAIYSLPGFEHLVGHPGLIVIDFESRNKPYYGEVVGILPFLQGFCPTTEQVETFLDLPPGTLTQRTLTYAVRVHPHRPLSANGEPAPAVMQAATDHALFQAERGVLGHHNFGARSYRTQAALGEAGSPSEICAQTQSGLGLFEGATAAMRAWRHSSGHWSIARKYHRYYGYDMVRGKNGAWYAVGFFIN